jgi:hypothetical protein
MVCANFGFGALVRAGDLALGGAPRYIIADFPTCRRRWVPNHASRAPMARQFLAVLTIPL